MKSVVIRCLGAVSCVVLMSSCGGDSVGTKVAKEVCECISKESATEGKIPGLGNALVPLGCLVTTAEKYKEYFDFGENNVKFKDPKLQKDFETALKKCAPEWALSDETIK